MPDQFAERGVLAADTRDVAHAERFERHDPFGCFHPGGRFHPSHVRDPFWHNTAMERDVFFVSDRTGITAETLGLSLLTQFNGIKIKKHTRRFVDTLDKARAVAAEIRHV